jgi:hypothetical protein
MKTEFKASKKENAEMSSRNIVKSVGKGGGKPDAVKTHFHSSLWRNIRFASPPRLKEHNT